MQVLPYKQNLYFTFLKGLLKIKEMKIYLALEMKCGKVMLYYVFLLLSYVL